MLHTNLNILVVEDNPIDAKLILMALKQAGVTRAPEVVDDGIPALALLRGDGQYQGRILPDMVILDLNLKRVDGPEVLAYIRETPHLSGLCVAILSSSPSDVMIKRAAQANCYFTKPSDLSQFLSLGKNLLNCYSNSGAR
jgi:CheY-like chemotaxis protein